MLVTYFVNFRWLNDHLFEKKLFIRFTAGAFRKLPSICVFSYLPFGFEGRIWNLIVSVPDHCLSFYFRSCSCKGPLFRLLKDGRAKDRPSSVNRFKPPVFITVRSKAMLLWWFIQIISVRQLSVCLTVNLFRIAL